MTVATRPDINDFVISAYGGMARVGMTVAAYDGKGTVTFWQMADLGERRVDFTLLGTQQAGPTLAARFDEALRTPDLDTILDMYLNPFTVAYIDSDAPLSSWPYPDTSVTDGPSFPDAATAAAHIATQYARAASGLPIAPKSADLVLEQGGSSDPSRDGAGNTWRIVERMGAGTARSTWTTVNPA